MKAFKILFCSSVIALSSFANAGTITPADAAIVSDVNAKLAADKTTADSKVQVTSHNGVVTLTGKVATNDQADALIQIAESAPNVKDVETSHLKVNESRHGMADASITAKVKGMYVREKLFGDKDISVMGVKVETTNGVVYLTGTVETQAEADNAVKFAKVVKGVKKVDSKLAVNPAS